MQDVEREANAQIDKAPGAGIRFSHIDPPGNHVQHATTVRALSRPRRALPHSAATERRARIAINPEMPAGFNMNAVPIDKVLQMTARCIKDGPARRVQENARATAAGNLRADRSSGV